MKIEVYNNTRLPLGETKTLYYLRPAETNEFWSKQILNEYNCIFWETNAITYQAIHQKLLIFKFLKTNIKKTIYEYVKCKVQIKRDNPQKILGRLIVLSILEKLGSVAFSVLFRKWKELLVADASREVIFSDTQNDWKE